MRVMLWAILHVDRLLRNLAKAPSGAQSHPGIIQYKDTWYYFYHRGDYTLNGITFSL